MIWNSVCLVCEELRENLLNATHQHATALMHLDGADREVSSENVGNLERSLEQARLRQEEAVRAYETHQRVHTESGSIA